jgi:dTDP-glucose pyrophosphorylase
MDGLYNQIQIDGGVVFLLTMSDPEHYGVVEVLINLKSSVN